MRSLEITMRNPIPLKFLYIYSDEGDPSPRHSGKKDIDYGDARVALKRCVSHTGRSWRWYRYRSRRHLFVILIIAIVDDIEESELVDTLGGRDDTKPIPEQVLLQEFLRPID